MRIWIAAALAGGGIGLASCSSTLRPASCTDHGPPLVAFTPGTLIGTGVDAGVERIDVEHADGTSLGVRGTAYFQVYYGGDAVLQTSTLVMTLSDSTSEYELRVPTVASEMLLRSRVSDHFQQLRTGHLEVRVGATSECIENPSVGIVLTVDEARGEIDFDQHAIDSDFVRRISLTVDKGSLGCGLEIGATTLSFSLNASEAQLGCNGLFRLR